MVFEGVKLAHVLPCLADTAKIRAVVEFDGEIGDVMPYLNALIANGAYNHETRTLTYNKDGKMITIYPRKMTIAKAADAGDALRIAEEFRGFALRTWDDRDRIEPSTERRKRLSAVDVVKLLPLTNCKKCGEPSCLALAVKLCAEENPLNSCPPLFTAEFKNKRKLLAQVMVDAGYQVPEVFR